MYNEQRNSNPKQFCSFQVKALMIFFLKVSLHEVHRCNGVELGENKNDWVSTAYTF